MIRRKLDSLRVQVSAASAVIGVAIISIAALVLLNVAESSLEAAALSDVEAVAQQTAVALQAGLKIDDLVLPVRADGTQTRVLDGNGRLLAISPALTRLERDDLGAEVQITVDPNAFPNGPNVVSFSTNLDHPTLGPLVVESARSSQPILEAIATIRAAAIWLAPVTFAAIGALAYMASTRSLRPVLDMARDATAIDDTHRDQRIPVPPRGAEVKELAENLNSMLERFDTARSREENLVSDVAHELRTPLTAIGTRLDTALRSQASAETRDELIRAQEDLDRLSQITSDLLEVSRLAADIRSSPEHRPLRLDQLVASTISGSPGAGDISCDLEPGTVMGEPRQLTRLLTNLIDNASRHCDHTVRVRVFTRESSAVLSVEDDGPGIPQLDRDRVFDRFVRGDEARDRQSGGAGLGLSICKAIVERHRGEIFIEDSQLGGAAVVVQLPLLDASSPVLTNS